MAVTDQEVIALIHSVSAFPQLAEKVASAEGSAFAQQIGAVGADVLYDVMDKKACASGADIPHHRKVVRYIDKLAQQQGKAPLSPEWQLKIAATVAADDAITLILPSEAGEKTATEYGELFGMRSFGREFLVDTLQKVL